MFEERQKRVEENIKSGMGPAVRPTNEDRYNPNILLEILKM
jgi:hypothetical protein